LADEHPMGRGARTEGGKHRRLDLDREIHPILVGFTE
jgi:hypothetical protein